MYISLRLASQHMPVTWFDGVNSNKIFHDSVAYIVCVCFLRQIGKMLNAREPKIVNGPEILDKYVGESEANIRKLFAPAEEEEKRVGLGMRRQ